MITPKHIPVMLNQSIDAMKILLAAHMLMQHLDLVGIQRKF